MFTVKAVVNNLTSMIWKCTLFVKNKKYKFEITKFKNITAT